MEDKTFLKKMGSRISVRRRMMGLTQEDLAEKIDVSTQMISNLETGKKAIRPENLLKICNALDVSADFLLTGSDRSTSQDPMYRKFSALPLRERQLLTDLIDYMDEK